MDNVFRFNYYNILAMAAAMVQQKMVHVCVLRTYLEVQSVYVTRIKNLHRNWIYMNSRQKDPPAVGFSRTHLSANTNTKGLIYMFLHGQAREIMTSISGCLLVVHWSNLWF